MAYLVLVINTTDSINDAKAKTAQASDSRVGADQLINYLSGGVSGAGADMSIQVTVRDTDPAVTTHGTGSVQVTYNLA